jgi:hypothetical protein
MVSELVLVVVGASPYAWSPDAGSTVEQRFSPPKGFTRVAVASDSFGAWLRGLPLEPPGTPVLLHDGAAKGRQDVHAAVISIDVGTKDLQQCADAVMRLRAEWLYGTGHAKDVSFNDTGKGAPMPFSRWAKGERPKAKGNALVWSPTQKADESRASFRQYLDTVFMWAGTSSLEKQLKARAPAELQPGDVVIKGGFPGHAVLVLDVAVNDAGERRVLLAQSYMPAQSLHVLKGADGEPWFPAPDEANRYVTPEWTFPPGSLKTW